MTDRPLAFDPVAEARRQWEAHHWDVQQWMAAATSVMRVQQIVLARVDAVLKPHGLTFARYEALVLLYFSRRGSLPMGKMGNRLMVHPTSVTNAVDRLEADGLVRRAPHPTDRRTVLAELTAEGRSRVEAATSSMAAIRYGVAELTDDGAAQVFALLRVLRIGSRDFVSAEDD